MKWKTMKFWKKKRLQEKVLQTRDFSEQIRKLVYAKLAFVKRDKMERELFHSCVMLKNMAIVHQELPMSTDFLLEQLMESGGCLRSVYADVLALYRKGELEQAFDLFPQSIHSREAIDFARILSKMDQIQPADLVSQMNGFEETFSAERKTKAMARAERKSLITTLTSTVTIFVILLNFTVVVIFLDTLRVLGQLF